MNSNGKSNIPKYIIDRPGERVVLIADGAAFGSQMDSAMGFLSDHNNHYLYLPESFEWLLLDSGIFRDKDLSEKLNNTADYVESSKYLSWERFFTELLEHITENLRRAGITCDLVGFSEEVEGTHEIVILCDRVIGEDVADYDMVILPGGYPGAEKLRDSDLVMKILKEMDGQGKYLAAMCSGTIVLSDAQAIEGKKVTGYTGYAEKLHGGIFCEEVVVADKNIITSQGPATPYPFAFKIAERLGKKQEVDVMKERLMYNFAGGR